MMVAACYLKTLTASLQARPHCSYQCSTSLMFLWLNRSTVELAAIFQKICGKASQGNRGCCRFFSEVFSNHKYMHTFDHITCSYSHSACFNTCQKLFS